MTDIQQARDILAKWREAVESPLPWALSTDGQDSEVEDGNGASIVQLFSREAASWAGLGDGDARLIVGTAGNPDLLDAIDGLLELALTYGDLPPGSGSRFITRAERIATAVIAADEQMTS